MTEAVAVSPVLTNAQIVARVAGVSPSDLASIQTTSAPLTQQTGPSVILASNAAQVQTLIGVGRARPTFQL